ncbi:hypothetical protein AB1Y20_013218 [Prymnesium parvum]|uniref:C2 domain-containing protein n=1 Tax=Prymnesium parvum TaxID=97485 RepID=A0AB34INK6_PRYPA
MALRSFRRKGGAPLPPPPVLSHPGTSRTVTPRSGMTGVEQRLRSHGTLTVLIKSGKIVGGASMDVHLRVSIGRHEFHTTVAHHTAEPQWNEHLDFKGVLHEFMDSTLAINLWENKGRDHKRGQTSISLRGILDYSDHKDLDMKLSDGSMIKLSIKWEKDTDERLHSTPRRFINAPPGNAIPLSARRWDRTATFVHSPIAAPVNFASLKPTRSPQS